MRVFPVRVIRLIGLLLIPFSFLQGQVLTETTKYRHAGNFFDPGYILEDRNRDSITDYIHCTLVLPANPTEAEITSAANIAARLGYETTSADFLNIQYDSEKIQRFTAPVIIIGLRNKFLQYSTRLIKNAGRDLGPGQGDLCFIKHDNFFTKGGVAVTGYDATGLIHSANYFAGRYPEIWSPAGKKYSDIHKQFNEYLVEKRTTPEEIFSSRIVVDNNNPGVHKLVLEIGFAEESSLDSAKQVLKQKPEKSQKSDKKEKDNSKKIKRESLDFFGLHRIETELHAPGKSESVNLFPMRTWEFKPETNGANAQGSDFSLSKLYSIMGMFSDSNKDYIPDNVKSYMLLKGTDTPEGIINLAFRTGLETAGMRFPFVVLGGEEEHPEKLGLPILIGRNHYSIDRLIEENRLQEIPSRSGTGFVQFIPEAFEKNNAIVISGTDERGLSSITDYLSGRLPYLWEYGKGKYRLEQIENDVRKFFQVKNASGQATVALYKLNTWLNRMANKQIQSVNVELALKETPVGLSDFAENLVKSYFPDVDLQVKTYKTGFGLGKEIFREEFQIPWEVDEFWKIFKEEALPELGPTDQGYIEVRVSESPEIRDQIKNKIIAELNNHGIDEANFDIAVLSAYKQGFSWLHDVILPKIKNKEVGTIAISYHTLKESEEIRWQTVNANTRWLQEIFPIDTVLARELKIPASKVTFHRKNSDDPIYSVVIKDNEGDIILEESFNPQYVIRPFFDLFPEYESVRVTTGWVKVKADNKLIVDRRIKTDPEIFWDHLQTNTYRKIIDYVMDIQDGKPSGMNAPFFDEFIVDLTLSEPNYRLNIDEEVISSTEALHEDIMFHTLALFNRIGDRYGVGGLRYPGRILPLVRPPSDGKPGHAKISFTGKEKALPELVFAYKEGENELVTQRYPVMTLGVKAPKLRGIEVNHGEQGVNKLLFDVVATDSVDRYEEFKLRGSEVQIDQNFIAIDKISGMVNILGQLHKNGLYADELSYDKINELVFRVTLEDSLLFSKLVALRRSASAINTSENHLPVIKNLPDTKNLIQWDTPMPPGEVAINLSLLNRYPEINAYYMETSFMGRNVYAADITLPHEGTYLSQAKLNALKPSLLLIGRVHGNEVSSTSHQLKLAELCATDTSYKKFLKRVNLVIYPMVNPDGAQTAYDMYLDNPDFMLHAGRYGALGTDVARGGRNLDNRYPESSVVYRLRETWLPDIFVDMHGVPSHEWVQYFAGYSAWVNSRSGGARSYWLPRGWYIPGFSWIEDKNYPELMKAQKAITDSITTGVMSIPDIRTMNERFYDRYIKYGKQDPDTYREYFYEGVQLEARLKGRKISNSGITGPNITYYSITTESADETAYGDWLNLVCIAGLTNSTALLNYLSGGQNRINHETIEYRGFLTRRAFRKKPVLPVEKDTAK